MARRSELVRQRKVAGFSQERLAHAMEVDRSTIARWEAGEATPLPTFRPQLARLLNLTPDALDRILDDDLHPTPAGTSPTIVISGSRAPGCDERMLDETVAALARLVAFSGAVVNHGPVGIGIEVVTYVADQFRPAGFAMSTARFGRENVVHGADLMVVAGGGAGTAAEVAIAQALSIPVLPFARTGGTAARVLEELRAAAPSDTGLQSDLERCTTPNQFTALIERAVNEIGTPL